MEATLRGIPFQELHSDQKICIRKCQSLAGQAIEGIASEWTQNQYSGWPAVWFLFQACTIPLLSLYGVNGDSQQKEVWNQQVQKAIHLFKEMDQWSIAARQTHGIVSLLYDAYHKSLASNSDALECRSTSTSSARSLVSPQPVMAPTQNHNSVELPLWEGLFNFPDLVFPVSVFPDLNFPEFGPGAETSDIPMEMEDWSDD
jgi:hypothetical protein